MLLIVCLLAAECGCPHPHCQTNRTASSPASKDPGWIGAPLLGGGSPPCRNSQPEGDGVHCLAEGKWKATGSCEAGTYPRVRRPCTPSTSRRTRCAVVEIQFTRGTRAAHPRRRRAPRGKTCTQHTKTVYSK